MIYPENFESKIKFDKIRQLISNNCLSDMGRELVSAIKFSTDAGWIETSLAETSEFMRICQEEENFPVSYYHDALLVAYKSRGFVSGSKRSGCLKKFTGVAERHHAVLQHQTRSLPSSGSPGRRRTGIPLYPATSGLDRFKIRDNQGYRLTRFRQHTS